MSDFLSKKITRKKRSLWRMLFPVALLLLVAATLAAAYFVLVPGPGRQASKRQHPGKEPAGQAPPLERKARPPDKTASSQPPPSKENKLPRIAIIIDDMGYREQTGKKMLQLDLELSFAFLPFAPHTESLLKVAAQGRREILLHLPLEAEDPLRNGEPGTLTLAMPQKELANRLQLALASVPQAVGVNNHMGSKFTANAPAMRQLLTLVRERQLFFIDSLTSSASRGHKIARELGVKTARRDFFIDNVQEAAVIMIQLESLVKLATKRGEAIAIGHPYPETLKALTLFMERRQQKVRLTPISELIH